MANIVTLPNNDSFGADHTRMLQSRVESFYVAMDPRDFCNHCSNSKKFPDLVISDADRSRALVARADEHPFVNRLPTIIIGEPGSAPASMNTVGYMSARDQANPAAWDKLIAALDLAGAHGKVTRESFAAATAALESRPETAGSPLVGKEAARARAVPA